MKHCKLKSVNTSSYIQHWKQQLTVFLVKKPRPHSKQNPCDVKGMNVLTFGRICKGRRSRISSIVFSSSSLNQWNRPNVSPDDRENVQLALRDRVHPECPGPERTGQIRFRKSKPDWRTSHTQVNPLKRFSVIATSPPLHQRSSSALSCPGRQLHLILRLTHEQRSCSVTGKMELLFNVECMSDLLGFVQNRSAVISSPSISNSVEEYRIIWMSVGKCYTLIEIVSNQCVLKLCATQGRDHGKWLCVGNVSQMSFMNEHVRKDVWLFTSSPWISWRKASTLSDEDDV